MDEEANLGGGAAKFLNFSSQLLFKLLNFRHLYKYINHLNETGRLLILDECSNVLLEFDR